jgi:hypothetical protein
MVRSDVALCRVPTRPRASESPACGEEGFVVLQRCGAGLVDSGVVTILCGGGGQTVRSDVALCRGSARLRASEPALHSLLSGEA